MLQQFSNSGKHRIRYNTIMIAEVNAKVKTNRTNRANKTNGLNNIKHINYTVAQYHYFTVY